jgi:hypothetical protein
MTSVMAPGTLPASPLAVDRSGLVLVLVKPAE